VGIRQAVEGEVPPRVGVVAAEFNQAITEPMLEEAIAALEEAGVGDIVVLRVPGALELPVGADALAAQGCRAVVAIGAVIQGETDHYEIVSRESARGLGEVSLRRGIPIGNAVLTVREYGHALDRSRPGPGNKGREAAEAAVATARRLAGLEGGGPV
jgi:6,7-dimethyl-8-ribityllumazine synthase